MFVKLLRAGIININRGTYSTKFVPQTAIISSNYRYNNINQKRFYKNFGHKPKKEPLISRIWYCFMAVIFFSPLIDFKWYVQKYVS